MSLIERFRLDNQVAIVTDVLSNFVHTEKKTEIFPLTVNIGFDFFD